MGWNSVFNNGRGYFYLLCDYLHSTHCSDRSCNFWCLSIRIQRIHKPHRLSDRSYFIHLSTWIYLHSVIQEVRCAACENHTSALLCCIPDSFVLMKLLMTTTTILISARSKECLVCLFDCACTMSLPAQSCGRIGSFPSQGNVPSGSRISHARNALTSSATAAGCSR